MFLSKSQRLKKSWKEIIEIVKESYLYDYFDLTLSYRKWTFFRKDVIETENTFSDYQKYGQEEIIKRKVITKFNIENFPTKEEFYNPFKIDFIFN